jgi:hypothetical protein
MDAQPTAPIRAQLAAAEAYCAQNVPFPGLPLKLIDTRGPFTFLVYSNDSSNDFCTTGPSFTNASGWSTSPPVTVPAGKLYLWAEHTRAVSNIVLRLVGNTLVARQARQAAEWSTTRRGEVDPR